MSKKIKKINGIKYYVVISLVAVFGIAGFVVAYSGQNNGTVIENQVVQGDYVGSTNVEGPTFGAFSGPDIYSDLNIRGTMTTGGSKVFSTSTAEGGDTTIQLVQSDLANYAYIEYLNLTDTSAVTMTLPATSTMLAFLPEVGSTRSWYIHNATSSADGSPTLTIAVGTGMNLVGTGGGSDVIDEEVWVKLTCMQKTYISSVDENITCFLEEFVAAD